MIPCAHLARFAEIENPAPTGQSRALIARVAEDWALHSFAALLHSSVPRLNPTRLVSVPVPDLRLPFVNTHHPTPSPSPDTDLQADAPGDVVRRYHPWSAPCPSVRSYSAAALPQQPSPTRSTTPVRTCCSQLRYVLAPHRADAHKSLQVQAASSRTPPPALQSRGCRAETPPRTRHPLPFRRKL